MIINTIAIPLGYIMKFCYDILHNYALSIFVFTVLTRIIISPISIWVHKNSIKMVKLQPEINFMKAKYAGDNEVIAEKQLELYKKEKYSPMAGIIPLFIQIGLLMGVVGVIYHPLQHMLHIDANIITAFVNKAVELTGANPESGSVQLAVLEALSHSEFVPEFTALQSQFNGADLSSIITSIQSINTNLLGFDLTKVPVMAGGKYYLVPVYAGAAALLLCVVQNKINVLQSEQGKVSQLGMTVFSVGLSLYLGLFVPAGVGFYWICGNIVAIIQLVILNTVISPKKYIDYEALEESKKALAEVKADDKAQKNNPYRQKEKEDYKRFFKDDNKLLVFYSEKSGFYKYFENVINYIIENTKIPIHYVTSDPEDAIFKKDNPQIIPYYIGDKMLIPFMMKMDADMVVMSMPDLEKYHIKRSYVRKDIEYVYVPHGVNSGNLTLRTGALDHFDTVFAPCTHYKAEVIALEKLYNTKRKNIVEWGSGVLDNMIDSFNKMEHIQNEVKTILIAPSWQDSNILDTCIYDMLDNILDKGYRVIVRPHPQYVRHFTSKIDKLIEHYSDKIGENFVVEKDFSSNVTVYTADLLVTDWSGIAFEYSFATLKPTLFVDTPMKIMNPEYTKIDIVPFDIEARNLIGKSISPDNMACFEGLVKDLLENHKKYEKDIEQIRNERLYNIGHSGEAGGKYIIERLKEIESRK